MDDLLKKSADYEKELLYQQSAADDSRNRLDSLQNESRRIGDVAYSVNIEAQCKEREVQHLN
jgi:hypothetical protein